MKIPIHRLHGANHFKSGDAVRLNDGEDLKLVRIAQVTEPEASGVHGQIIYPPNKVGQIIFWHVNYIKLVSAEELHPLLEN